MNIYPRHEQSSSTASSQRQINPNRSNCGASIGRPRSALCSRVPEDKQLPVNDRVSCHPVKDAPPKPNTATSPRMDEQCHSNWTPDPIPPVRHHILPGVGTNMDNQHPTHPNPPREKKGKKEGPASPHPAKVNPINPSPTLVPSAIPDRRPGWAPSSRRWQGVNTAPAASRRVMLMGAPFTPTEQGGVNWESRWEE